MATPTRFRLSDQNDDVEVALDTDEELLTISADSGEVSVTIDGIPELVQVIQQLGKGVK